MLDCNAKLRHVLITRFNLATLGREPAYRARSGWLERRFDLFERFCLPSVAAQSEQDFEWLLYFDELTPTWARERIDRLKAIRPFQICYTPLFGSDGWARTVRGVVGPPVQGRVLLTSNLDNDDALACDYIARVQEAARKHLHAIGADQRRFAINLPEGFVLSRRALFVHVHRQNAFTNLVEPDGDGFATTMSIRHMELAGHVEVVQAHGSGAWLQVVHDSNVSNRVRGRRARRADALARFPLEATSTVVDPAFFELMIDVLFLTPVRRLRDGSFTLLRRFYRVDREQG